MTKQNIKTYKELLSYSIKNYPENTSFCSVNGEKMTYSEFGQKVKSVTEMFDKYGISFSDKVAIYSQNMPNWPVSFFAIQEIGCIAVPMLPDFSEMEVTNIVKHSDSRAIFISEKLYNKLSQEAISNLELIINIDRLEPLKFPTEISTYERKDYTEEHLSSIIYTSGTTGNSKGVMLTHKNLISHLQASEKTRPSFEWDVWLSLLPLSHTLELSLEMSLAFISGGSVYYMDKTPSPTILLQALKKVRPTTICIVPLIIEKIFKSSVLPTLTKSKVMKTVYKTTLGRKLLHRIAGKKLLKSFGGNIRFLGVGGAKLDGDVERFLIEGKVPYTIGYGLTECSPLISAAAPEKHDRWQSAGYLIDQVEVKILNPDPKTGIGEILAKGPNIMQGYYKNPEATKEAFTEDGWFRTKDTGILDSKGRIYIKGRISNMILGASGENIYPEEIETVINSHPAVAESLVMESKKKLIAKIYFDPNKLEKLKQDIAEISNLKQEIQKYVNSKVNKFSRIALVVEQTSPFEKTATHKIKRYKYLS